MPERTFKFWREPNNSKSHHYEIHENGNLIAEVYHQEFNGKYTAITNHQNSERGREVLSDLMRAVDIMEEKTPVQQDAQRISDIIKGFL